MPGCRYHPGFFIFPRSAKIIFMPRETAADKVARTQKIISALKRVYPDAHCELDHASPLQLLIATILSAQCTDKRVNMVTVELFKKYLSANDFAVAKISE